MDRFFFLLLSIDLIPIGLKAIINEKIDLGLWYHKGYQVKYGWEAQVVGIILIIIGIYLLIKYITDYKKFTKIIRSNIILKICLIIFAFYSIFPALNHYVFRIPYAFVIVIIIVLHISLVIFHIIYSFRFTHDH